MNYAIVLRLLSYILYCEAALLLLPAMASLIYGEWMVLGVFLLTAALSAVAGALLHRIKPKSQIFYMREGFATTALCWLLISVIFAASFFLISLDGFDMVTNFTAIAATLNNIGPGLAQVGPMMNFGSYSNPAKLVMIFDMLAGRLEIFPMLVFFMPDTWRRF